MLGWKYLITPLWSAEARKAPELVNRIARIAVSCAWRIVSKLNVSPFHSVNSPLVDPVKTRRHSGVHYNNSNALEQIRGGTSVRRCSPQRNSLGTESCLSTCERTWCITTSKSFLGRLSAGEAENVVDGKRDIFSEILVQVHWVRKVPYIDYIRRRWPHVR